MGIRGLERIIKCNNSTLPHKENIIKQNLSAFYNKKICIDTSEFIVRSLLKDNNYHVSGILNLLEKCFKYNITPCFVFDGKPPEEKKLVLNERNKKKLNAQQKILELNEQQDEIIEINELINKLNKLNTIQLNKSKEKLTNNTTITDLNTSNNNININNDNDNDSDSNINNDNDSDSDKEKLKKEIISRISSSNSLIDLGINTSTTSPNDNQTIDNYYNEEVFINNSFTNTIHESIENKLLFISNEKTKQKKKM